MRSLPTPRAIIIIAWIILSLFATFASDYEFELNCPYWYIWFNRAGYADITHWYPSPRHDVSSHHEMMTGDWAGAIWYQGLGNEAEWLTNHFTEPSFYTQTPFVKQNYNVYNNPSNPVWDDPCQPEESYDPASSPYDNGDTAWSTVKNTTDNKLEITIHYEVVDLGEYVGSPLAKQLLEVP